MRVRLFLVCVFVTSTFVSGYAQALRVRKELRWTTEIKHDQVANTDNKLWSVLGQPSGSMTIVIVNCKTIMLVIPNDVLDTDNQSVEIKYRTSDMSEAEHTVTFGTLHAAVWSLDVGTTLFWRGLPTLERRIFMDVPIYPEKTKTVTFDLPHIPAECQL